MDGEAWTLAGLVETGTERDPERRAVPLEVVVPGGPVRYVRVRAVGHTLPDWHPGAGENAWVFADEILIQEG